MGATEAIIFLDIDGVLNGHEWREEAGSCVISQRCVGHLNTILSATGARIVLSSAWRYMIFGGEVTCKGFGYLLRSHGMRKCEIIDTTCPDEQIEDRGKQIQHWILKQRYPETIAWVVLDDEHVTGCDGHFVKTHARVGLTEPDAGMAIKILLAQKNA